MDFRFVSTAIPYVNAAPHIGFALELILADVIARHSRKQGAATCLLTGTDENSLKNALAAAGAGMNTPDFVERHANEFKALSPLLNISTNDFIRTSVDPRHKPAVEKLWHACDRSGDIYADDYLGLYCVGCEQFYLEKELADGYCPDHRTKPEKVAERNYFFRLSRYQDELIELLKSDHISIKPAHRKNEMLSFLNSPLADLSISRSVERARGWGIKVPGDSSQIVYVWFDALANYISALGYGANGETFAKYWSGANRVSHVIGKGVTRFHAVYWPAILLSAGQRLPSDVLVHGYITIGGQKISKSLCNTISPQVACRRYGTDALRYYLLRHVGGHRDGDFSWARLSAAYDQELVNDLGNLISRVNGLVRKYGAPSAQASPLTTELHGSVDQCLDEFAPQRALDTIWAAIAATNAYINQTAPWSLAKQGKISALGDVLGELVATLHDIGDVLAPFLPDTAQRIISMLETTSDEQLFPRQR